MFFSQPPARDLRVARPEPLVGSGSVIVGADAVRDARPQGFHARITAHAGAGAYGFVRVDDLGFATVEGDAAAFGDGIDLPAHEITGRTDVPTDGTAVVRLEPLRGALGYGFRYASATPASTTLIMGETMRNNNNVFGGQLTADDTWFDACTTFFELTLPVTSNYMLSATISVRGSVTGDYGSVWGRFFNITTGIALGDSLWLIGVIPPTGEITYVRSSSALVAASSASPRFLAGTRLKIQAIRMRRSISTVWGSAVVASDVPVFPTIGVISTNFASSAEMSYLRID